MSSVLIRFVVAVTAIGAASFASTSVPTDTRQAAGPTQTEQKKPDPRTQATVDPPPQKPKQGPPPKPSQKPPPPQKQPPQKQPQRLPEPQQQVKIGQQQQRLAQYGAQLDQWQRQAPQIGIELQRQNRTAQFNFQILYVARMRDQQLSIQNSRNYNYGGDPYFYTPNSYRYMRGGRYYETNDYGASVLRQAINYGYEEGFGAGQADRQDRWRYGYQDSYAYLDGNYGYGGFYVDRDDYNYYFREGFRRGYDDGYYGRHQYGSYSTGHYSVLGSVLSLIINLQPLR